MLSAGFLILYMNRPITSRDNSTYKRLLRLNRKKYRDREKMYLAEGENIVNEALRDEDCIDLIVLREDMSSALRQLREKTGKPVQILSSKLFDEVTDTQSAQGILAVVKKRMYDVNDIKDRCTDAANILVLDRLQDPGNIGTVIRTAEACGYGGVICMKGTVEPFSPKVVRARSEEHTSELQSR